LADREGAGDGGILLSDAGTVFDLRQFCCRIHPGRKFMLKILLPVDGSPCAVRATQMLIEMIGWYREAPSIEVLSVHLPVPRVPNLGSFVSKEMIQKYYADECAAMLAPTLKLLDAAGVPYVSHALTGPIAETIVEKAKESGSNMIFMGTRGMSALANMALGSVTTRVLHLGHIPVVLIR
jgi:nucleotide-binding universal stress UspA family protein